MKIVYSFGHGLADGDGSMSAVLGGKGAGLASMSSLGIPVPPGFTVPTQFCRDFYRDGESVLDLVFAHASDAYGTLCGAQANPHLMVSVRSGAPVSMPGMMNTILNVGLTPAGFEFWSAKMGKRATLDCYRRLIQMLGSTAYGIEDRVFEDMLSKARFRAKVTEDHQLSEDDLAELVKGYSMAFQLHAGVPFPTTVGEQLRAAIGAVYKSWMQPRAVTYRDLNKLDHDMGTAVTVQTMVFGNMNARSGSGVLFTRHPTTGENLIYGEFLVNAQGEDVVAGIRTPLPMSDLFKLWPMVGKQIIKLCHRLEDQYRDMMDVEFTVEDKKLYLLQCRAGKRSSLAKLVIATDLAAAGNISTKEALGRLTRDDVRLVLQPRVDPTFTVEPTFVGIGSTIGVATGVAVLTTAAAIASPVPCILVRSETDPDDIGGMAAAVGILTRTGGATSHAAVVARAMNKPAVVGCTALRPDLEGLEGRTITVCGSTGRVWLDVTVPVSDASNTPQLETLALMSQRVSKDKSLPIMLFKDHSQLAHATAIYASREDVANLSGSQMYDILSNHIAYGTKLVIDLRGSVESDDDELDALFGGYGSEVPVAVPLWTSNISALNMLRKHKALVLASGALADSLRKRLIHVVSPAKTLDDMLDQGTLLALPSLIEAMGASTFSKLTGALKKAGFTKGGVTAAPPAYTLMSALS